MRGVVPLRATMFQAVGLNIMAARETKRDFWFKSKFSTKNEQISFSFSAMVVVRVAS
jgi:hypothetical protein